MFIEASPLAAQLLPPLRDPRYDWPWPGYVPTQTTDSCSGPCEHCGMFHYPAGAACHRVKAIEYHENGAVKRVEYKD